MTKNILAALMLTLIFSLSVFSYNCTVSGGRATITYCERYISGAVTIPSTIADCPVTSIGTNAFSGCKSITSIIIPDGVTSICNNAFSYCTSLESIEIPDSVTSIDKYAFYDCINLVTVYYGGTSADFENVTVYSNNDCFNSANKVFNRVIISYNANGGENAPKVQIKSRFSDVFVSSEIPTRTGYDFLGWSTSANGNVEYEAGASFTIEFDTTLYAVWQSKTCSVTYDANGGENAPQAQTKKHFEDLVLSSDKPTRTGYDFLGWSTSANGNVEYEAGASFTTEADTTLYAVWQLKTYSVTYNANGGENSPEMQTKKHFEDLVLSSDVPTRTGYDFLGWSTSANGNVEYEAGANFTTEAETTLYAVWRLKTYSITYNTNGGENEIENQIKKHFEDLIISEDVPINTGYAFLGWSTTRNGKVEYNPGDVYTKNEALELYAVWQINTYLVTYDANGGENAPETQTKKHFEDLVLSSDEPTRTGYNFLGWSTSSNGNVEYEAGAIFLNESDTILFAVWEIKLYDIKYDATGGESAPNTQIKKYFDSLVLSKNMPTKKGCVFLGWSTTPSGEVEYAPGAIFDKNEDTTLYAVWFINASGNCGFNLKWKMYGTKLTITGTGSMANWSESTSVPWSAYKDEIETVVISDGVTSIGSYAFSDCENLKTVTFTETVKKINSHAFDNATSIEAINFTGSLGDLESIEISGYNDSFMNGSFNFDYVITYTITYNTLGGMSDIQEQSKNHGEPTTLSTEVPTRIGHAFLGWSVEQGGEIVYNAGDEYTENVDIVLYAVWEEVKGDVSGDGELTQEDMDIIIEAMFGKELTDEEFKYANVYDEDDVINIKDLIALAQMLSQSQNA